MNPQNEHDSLLDQALDNRTDWRRLHSELAPLVEMAERVRTALEETPPPPHSLRPGRSTFLSAGAQRPSRRWESAISNIGRSLMGLMPFATVFALALLLSTVYIFTRFWHTPALTDRWSKPSPSPMVASPVFSSDQALETATKGPGDSSGASNLESPSHDRSPAAPTQTPTASAPAAPTTNKGAPSTPALAPTHASEETPASITPTDAPDLTPSVTPTPPLAPTLTPTPPPPSITNTPAATITPPRRPPRTPPSRPTATPPRRPPHTPPVRPPVTPPRRPSVTPPHRPTVTPPAFP